VRNDVRELFEACTGSEQRFHATFTVRGASTRASLWHCVTQMHQMHVPTLRFSPMSMESERGREREKVICGSRLHFSFQPPQLRVEHAWTSAAVASFQPPRLRVAHAWASAAVAMDDSAPLRTPQKRPLAATFEPSEKPSTAKTSRPQKRPFPATLEPSAVIRHRRCKTAACMNSPPHGSRCTRCQWLRLHRKYKARLPLGLGFPGRSWITMRVRSKGVGCKACEWFAKLLVDAGASQDQSRAFAGIAHVPLLMTALRLTHAHARAGGLEGQHLALSVAQPRRLPPSRPPPPPAPQLGSERSSA
jgi:hypothetical protein